MIKRFDVIVVGGGHAGCEAAHGAAAMGATTLLVTQNIETIGQMSCNPAIGGIGKSHLVKEIDALGGLMALATDEAGIQFRRLNASRGAAVRATRAQCDRQLYKMAVCRRLQAMPHLHIVQDSVLALLIKQGAVVGVHTATLGKISGRAVVLTTGTFLNGVMHIGSQQQSGGRAGCRAATDLAAQLSALNLPLGRLKTGTPARLDGRSIDFRCLDEQAGDTPLPTMSFSNRQCPPPRQVSCHVTQTNAQTHEIIAQSLAQSPLFNGSIEAVGPRYCPSIEDKVHRFADREHHRIFLEPEGLNTHEYYPNGISTSLPYEVQEKFIRTIAGLEQVHITRPGYAIEYDFIDPRALLPSLQLRPLPALFLAGQINGTTGYEEAGAQGLVAGVNAVRYARGEAAWVLAREQCYIGVMIDDLTARGVTEPYRMFTSRAEYRLSLREDNADLRLTELGYHLGVVSDNRYRLFCQRRERLAAEEARLKQQRASESVAGAKSGLSCWEWLKRHEVHYSDFTDTALTDEHDIGEIEARVKYSGYIAHQSAQQQREVADAQVAIPPDFNFYAVAGLSNEVCEKLQQHQPATLRQARRISGVTAAAVSLLLASLKKQQATPQRKQ